MMTNAKNTKKTLLMSMLSLLLCVTMFIGTTFAWFTDSVSSANNIIKSGNLDVELEYWNGTEWVSVDGKSDILTNTLWEPGVTEVAYLRVANAGSLAFKYQLGINVLGETAGKNANGDDFRLSDYILFDVIEGVNGQTGPYANREAAVAAVANGKRISAGYTKAASMIADEELYLALVVYMPTNVGNEANHDGVNKPEIKLGVNIFATQLEYEEDSFGTDYDNGAPIMNAPAAVPSEGESIILNGSAESKVTVNVPAAVLGGLDNSVTAMTVAASAPIVDTANKTVTFTTIELVDQNGEQIDISNATAKVTVTLPVNGAFADGEIVHGNYRTDSGFAGCDGGFETVEMIDVHNNCTFLCAGNAFCCFRKLVLYICS
jgi:predicted ribosomally synthesized peptide with SipW-like signal peptide